MRKRLDEKFTQAKSHITLAGSDAEHSHIKLTPINLRAQSITCVAARLDARGFAGEGDAAHANAVARLEIEVAFSPTKVPGPAGQSGTRPTLTPWPGSS